MDGRNGSIYTTQLKNDIDENKIEILATVTEGNWMAEMGVYTNTAKKWYWWKQNWNIGDCNRGQLDGRNGSIYTTQLKNDIDENKIEILATVTEGNWMAEMGVYTQHS